MNEVIIVGSKGQDGQFLHNILNDNKRSIIEIDIDYANSSDSDWVKKVDISNFSEVSQFIDQVKPSQIYYLAAHHHSSEDQLGDLNDLLQKSYKVNVFCYLNFSGNVLNKNVIVSNY